MKIKRLFAQILAIALCLTLLCPLAALAEDTGSYAVINPTAMQKLVEDYANAKGYDKGNIRVGYCYLDTGDTWFYNGDSWGFGAGVYYVPMMMILAEWETDGKLTRDSKIAGYTLGDAEYYILTESNNTIKNSILYGAFGSDREMREKMQAYSSLKEADYDSDYMNFGYVSPRYLMDVLKTLYNENERFPNIIDCMKARGVNDCFHGAMGGAYDVAQQFGAFEEGGGNEYNNCMGIIYTPHPFALVVMTKNLGHTQEVMRDMAIIYKDYTLTLDGAYDKWNGKNEPATVTPTETEPEPAEQQPEGENEQPNAGQTIIPMPGSETNTEPETPTEEQPEQGGTQVIIPTEQGTPGEEPAQTEQEPEQQPEQQPEQKPEQKPEQQPEDKSQQEKQEKSPASGRMILLLVGAAIFVILFLFAIVRIVKNRRDEDYDDEDEDDEDEDDEDEDEDEDDEDLKY